MGNSALQFDHETALLRERVAAVSGSWAAELADTPVDGAAQRCEGSGQASQAEALSESPQPFSAGLRAIFEGCTLHYDTSGILGEDPPAPLRLLIGDWCYASGLCAIAQTGDLATVRSLADLISQVAGTATTSPDTGDWRSLWESTVSELTFTTKKDNE